MCNFCNNPVCTSCDPCKKTPEPCCKVKVNSFKCITNASITSTALGINEDDTLDEVITKIIAFYDTLTGFYKGDTGPQGPQGPRGKRGCRGPAGSGGDSIETVVNNNDGTVTITMTSGDVFTFTVATSAPIVVQNTLFVSKLGNNATGLRTRFDRHFLTIDAASTAAQPGDTVIVYPGDYQEVDNPFATGVNYFLHENVAVTCPTVVFGDTPGNAVNYNVRGYGSFFNTSANVGTIINLQENFSTIFLRHKEAQGGEDCIVVDCISVDIEGKSLVSQKGKLINISGSTSGSIVYENYDASSTTDKQDHIDINNLNLADTGKLLIKGKVLSDADTNSIVNISSVANSKIILELDIETVSQPPIFTVYQDSGIVKFKGSIKQALLGFRVDNPTVTTKLIIEDSVVQVSGIALLSEVNTANVTLLIKDSTLERLLTLGGEVITLTRNGTTNNMNVLIDNSRIINYETVAPSFGILLTGIILNFQIKNVEIYTKNAQNSIESSVPNNIALLSDTIVNTGMSANMTNVIATTALDITTTNPIVVEF